MICNSNNFFHKNQGRLKSHFFNIGVDIMVLFFSSPPAIFRLDDRDDDDDDDVDDDVDDDDVDVDDDGCKATVDMDQAREW